MRAPMEPGVAAAPQTLLLVEDDPSLAQVVEEHLLQLGYRVCRVDNGVDALRLMMEQDFHVVVCDMVMPRLPGNMLYLAVQRVKPALCERFIFVTGHGETAGVREFLALVSERVIAKPFNLDDLTAAIRRTIAEGEARQRRVHLA